MSNSPPANDGAPPQPSVSVIMPAWRAETTLRDSAASVLAQTRTDWELIIIDDASPDGTWKIASALALEDSRIRSVRLSENAGAAAARNRGLDLARGRWMAFLDADDLWLPEKLERQLAFMEETDTALSYTAFEIERHRKPRLHVTVPDRVTRSELLRGNVIGCLTAIYDRKVVGKVRFPNLRMRQDFALWLEILTRVPEARGLTEVLAIHRRQPGSLSSNLPRRLLGTWQMYREVAGLSVLGATTSLVAHLCNRLRNRRRI